MRKYALLYAVLAAIILAGFLMFSLTQEATRYEEIDYIAMNEISKQFALHWKAPEELSRTDATSRYTIIDNDSQVRYMSDEGLPDSLPTALKRGIVPIVFRKDTK